MHPTTKIVTLAILLLAIIFSIQAAAPAFLFFVLVMLALSHYIPIWYNQWKH